MKTLLICAIVLPLVSACASPSNEPADASYLPQEAVYTTGSNLPSKKAKSSNVQTLSADQAAGMVQPAAMRGPHN